MSELHEAALAERASIAAYLEKCAAIHDENAHRKGQHYARKYHAEACRMIAAAILRGEQEACNG